MSVEAFINPHGPAEQTGTLASSFNVFNRLDSTQQDGGCMAFTFGNDVHAKVHSIDHVNVGVTRWAEHDFRSLSQSARGMRRKIVRTKVSLDLHDPTDVLPALRYVHQIFPEQFPGNQDGVAIVKCA